MKNHIGIIILSVLPLISFSQLDYLGYLTEKTIPFMPSYTYGEIYEDSVSYKKIPYEDLLDTCGTYLNDGEHHCEYIELIAPLNTPIREIEKRVESSRVTYDLFEFYTPIYRTSNEKKGKAKTVKGFYYSVRKNYEAGRIDILITYPFGPKVDL